MGNDWPIVKLGDYCKKIGSGATPKGGSSVYLDLGDVCLIRSQNIYNEGFSESGLVYIDDIAATKLKNVEVEKNDVLLNITGDSVARVCLAPSDFLPARVNQHVAIIRPNAAEFDARFLRYLLASPKTQKLLLNLASAGATRNALTKGMIEDFEVSKPPVSVQTDIANLLESLDNKITLNRQINQTLEQMAQTLFKSWFVDFDPVIDNALDAGNPIPDELQHRAEARKVVRESEGFKPLPDEVRQQFPDAFEESELGWVPKGWGVQRLDVTLDLAYGKALKKTDRIDGDVPVYGSGGVNGTHNVSIVDGPGIIVGRKGTVGSLYWEPNNFYPIDTVFYVKPKSGYSMEYCYELLKTLGLEHMNTDAAVPGLNRNNAYRLVSAKPTPELIELFTQNASVYRSRISHCCSESNTLTKLRDTLLPKLISGELRLDEVELAVEQEAVSAEQQNER